MKVDFLLMVMKGAMLGYNELGQQVLSVKMAVDENTTLECDDLMVGQV